MHSVYTGIRRPLTLTLRGKTSAPIKEDGRGMEAVLCDLWQPDSQTHGLSRDVDYSTPATVLTVPLPQYKIWWSLLLNM